MSQTLLSRALLPPERLGEPGQVAGATGGGLVLEVKLPRPDLPPEVPLELVQIQRGPPRLPDPLWGLRTKTFPLATRTTKISNFRA